MKPTVKTDVAIVGAGAAGLFCASLLSRRDLKVIILESAPEPGRKLAASGGGHANFSNLDMFPQKFLAPPGDSFCRYALKQWQPRQMADFMKCLGFSIIEKEHGRLFLKERAYELVNKMVRECQKGKCSLLCGKRVNSIEALANHFLLHTDRLALDASRIVLALGSPARPQLSGWQDSWALVRNLGHAVIPPRPALTPLHYAPKPQEDLTMLAGIGVKVRVKLASDGPASMTRSWEDDLLFTHTGLSGPAILSASLYFTPASILEINFLPHENFERLLDSWGKGTPRSLLRKYLPQRLTDALLPLAVANRKVAELSRAERRALGQRINCYQLSNLKPAGLKSAEVCAGGVDLSELSPKSMESLLLPGLYICGEMQNVTGELGGYNLHWAFASAHMAALDTLRKLN